ncbi:hypothetical protein AWENTII_009197 [Aspergillus wentii]|nr:hypothetical protein MW887_000937 [Aspergillus wentii]
MSFPVAAHLLTTDPGLPRSNPTFSHWQDPPHPLATIQSPTFPEKTDVAIIGSGITGLSVARTLLEGDSSSQVTVLEARTLCSGATGRNGGQLAANIGEEYSHLVSMYGVEAVGRIAEFTFLNLQEMYEIANEYAGESEAQTLEKLRVFLTDETFESFKESITRLETDHPRFKGIYTILDADRLKQEHNITGAGGALLPAGTLWPYRLVTAIFANLLNTHKSRFSIEANTPATSVAYNPDNDPSHPYTIHTPRGPLRARKIAYCTNAYTGHLLPQLRGRVYPFKGTMTVQRPEKSVPNKGDSLSWGFHYPPSYSPQSKQYAAGLYYLAQNAKSGDFFFGGENASFDECLSADDSHVGNESITELLNTLPGFLGVQEPRDWELVRAWSGIMGFTADGLPVVGQLPSSLTERNGDGEYIAAAFNGYGMANCLLSGQALAKMMMGEDVSSWFPDAYGIHDERLRMLTVQNSMQYYIDLLAEEERPSSP